MQFRCVLVLRRRLTWVSQLTAGFRNKGTRRASVMKVRGGHRGPAQFGGMFGSISCGCRMENLPRAGNHFKGATSGVPDSPGASRMFAE